jgi:hypothetical protein
MTQLYHLVLIYLTPVMPNREEYDHCEETHIIAHEAIPHFTLTSILSSSYAKASADLNLPKS